MACNLISHDEWAFFEGFIRAVRHPKGRKHTGHRPVLDDISWIARTGARWCDLPEEFGRWSSVYCQFRRWALAGRWEGILDALNHAGIAPDKMQMAVLSPAEAMRLLQPYPTDLMRIAKKGVCTLQNFPEHG